VTAVYVSGLLALRAIEPDDLEELRALRNDHDTWTHLTHPSCLTSADQREWYESMSSRRGRMHLIACLPDPAAQKETGARFIASVRLDEFDRDNRSIRIGADVCKSLRRQGWGGQLYELLKRYCFDELNCNRVWLCVLETNEVARRLYQRQGFVEEGRYREAVFRHGRYVDYIIMSLLLREFAADCAERALLRERAAGREPDPRSWAAIAVARERTSTAGELADAEAGARSAGAAVAEAADCAYAKGHMAGQDAERAWQRAELERRLLALWPQTGGA
jgi:RimJ/RimL family protein N-acetyltransferase